MSNYSFLIRCEIELKIIFYKDKTNTMEWTLFWASDLIDGILLPPGCLTWKVLKKKLLASSYCWHHLCIYEHSKRCWHFYECSYMYFLNCVSSLKTCNGYANNKRNTILRYWRWIHFVIWPSVYALRISQYSFVSLPNETAREKRR